jgi:choline-sulfatase
MLQEANVAREAMGFVREQEARDRPWFLMASFSRPHWPFTAPRRHFERYWDGDGPTAEMEPPAVSPESDAATHPYIEGPVGHTDSDDWPEDEMRNRAGYFAATDYLDEVVGDLLGSLDRDGALENTIVVYTADHGEMAGEHGRGGKLVWMESSAGVPLLIQTPEQRAGDERSHEVETPVSLLDLFPTLAGMCDVTTPDGLDGADISDAVTEGAEPDRGPVFSDNFSPYNWGEGTEFRMVRDGRWKYVQHRDYPEALFDVRSDPREEHDLSNDPEGEAAEALERLRALVDETVDWEAFDERRAESKREVQERHLGLEVGSGNQYHLPDGRIVDADAALYHPHTLVRDPGQLINDYPGHTPPGHTWPE